jgi:transcriptional regulator with XRE-family HTH domain
MNHWQRNSLITFMPRRFDDIDLDELSRAVHDARDKKGWTLEELSYELRDCGLPTAQNKLWRLENKPPKRLDTELLLWLEKILEVNLLPQQNQVLLQDVLDLLDAFIEAESELPPKPTHKSLHQVYAKALQLKERA